MVNSWIWFVVTESDWHNAVIYRGAEQILLWLFALGQCEQCLLTPLCLKHSVKHCIQWKQQEANTVSNAEMTHLKYLLVNTVALVCIQMHNLNILSLLNALRSFYNSVWFSQIREVYRGWPQLPEKINKKGKHTVVLINMEVNPNLAKTTIKNKYTDNKDNL